MAIEYPVSVRVTLAWRESFDRVLPCILAGCGLRSYIDHGTVIITARQH